MQPEGVSVCEDACQLDPGWGLHQSVRSVRIITLPRAIGSSLSQCKGLKVELDSHADTCVVSRHALLIHEHPKVVPVVLIRRSQPERQTSSTQL